MRSIDPTEVPPYFWTINIEPATLTPDSAPRQGRPSRYAAAMTDALLVLVTAPDPETAGRLAYDLVGAGACACVNLVPQVRSIYRWKGQVEEATEVLCIIKTTRDRY